jgi:hypothetical protein
MKLQRAPLEWGSGDECALVARTLFADAGAHGRPNILVISSFPYKREWLMPL